MVGGASSGQLGRRPAPSGTPRPQLPTVVAGVWQCCAVTPWALQQRAGGGGWLFRWALPHHRQSVPPPSEDEAGRLVLVPSGPGCVELTVTRLLQASGGGQVAVDT